MRLGGFWSHVTQTMVSHCGKGFIPLRWKGTGRICAEWQKEIILTTVEASVYDGAGGGRETRIGSAVFEEIMVITNPIEAAKMKSVSTLNI